MNECFDDTIADNPKSEIHMSSFRRHFLDESINNLTILQTELAEELTAERRREAFRTVHTIKGGAQTFGLESGARLADKLENILADSLHFIDRDLLLEGIGLLINSLREDEAGSPADFLAKLQSFNRTTAKNDVLFTKIPAEVFRNFSDQERAAALQALREGKNIYCAEAGFDPANFADCYRKLRKVLSEKSEILASLPSEKYKSAGKMGFRIFLASRAPAEFLQTLVKDFTIEISSHACTDNESHELFKMLSRIAAHGENIAEKSGKRVRITILSNDVNLSAGKTKAFFDILLHLVRNAVDHAIADRGFIEIRFFEEPAGLYLSVADDGGGIDSAKLRARAVAKNLISGEDLLSEEQTLALVFAPELSTAERVTETSGRGVGLDAVKSAVEKMNGKISVKSRKSNGTIFEIFVPREEI